MTNASKCPWLRTQAPGSASVEKGRRSINVWFMSKHWWRRRIPDNAGASELPINTCRGEGTSREWRCNQEEAYGGVRGNTVGSEREETTQKSAHISDASASDRIECVLFGWTLRVSSCYVGDLSMFAVFDWLQYFSSSSAFFVPLVLNRFLHLPFLPSLSFSTPFSLPQNLSLSNPSLSLVVFHIV